MKNNNLLIKASKKVALAVLAASMLVSPCAATVVKAEVIEKDGYSIVTGEDVPEYIREQEGEDISVERAVLEDGWIQYYGSREDGTFLSYIYIPLEDCETLAHNVWRYVRNSKQWYENGKSVYSTTADENEVTDLSTVPVYILEVAGEFNKNREICRKVYDESWVEYYGTDSEGKEFSYMYTVNDGEEILADEVWRYDENGKKYWYEDGVETESGSYETGVYTSANWVEENGKLYWYEDGVKQGVKYNEDGTLDESYRGKEIYDKASDAWYWLDAVQGGAMATNKDVYQDSYAGGFADNADGTGKWVRYDENGHMVKGWQETDKGTYYFDLKTGAMAKGIVQIEGYSCTFDVETGVFISKEKSAAPLNGWYEADGKKYWYEDGVRQGLVGRGKEIYDSETDAWYWCDSVQNGAIAVSKDVYQESYAGKWGEYEGEDGRRYGKWVRYDENGHMVKGWDKTTEDYYYFDEETGTMAKGWCELPENAYGFKYSDDGFGNIDGMWHKFDEETGILIRKPDYTELPSGTSIYYEED